ncbi:BrnA antitoxin family protein [Gallibacterium genomosp. 1]|uniref:BrnA antitoxin family protein n=1 Tax=Gallibacterium genomosp. 1 TaxID=155515 RepID=UPI001E50425F|nr:BrnA antitoxin family protein [Gallibacterium genomosp. 1]
MSPVSLTVMKIEFDAVKNQQKRRGKQKAPTKQATTIRLSPIVLEKFRATAIGGLNATLQ